MAGFIVDLGISETRQTGAVSTQRKRENETGLVGLNVGQVEPVPTGWKGAGPVRLDEDKKNSSVICYRRQRG